jgi:hypothetical protein
MAKLVLIDHSLEQVGGHHYEYALHMLQAAAEAGFDIYLAAHRRFSSRGLPVAAPVFPLFAHNTYAPYASYIGRGLARPMDLIPLPGARDYGWLEPLRQRWCARDRRRRTRHFAEACRELFRQVHLASGDQVFLPTLSEFDLAGLVEFLAAEPATRRADWHLQFHFGVFDGRVPDYAEPHQQARLRAMREVFQRQLQRVPEHRLWFWSTTAEMADQYNRLAVAPFRELPYPVNPEYCVEETPRRGGPLRVTCAGYLRAEKGRNEVGAVITELWEQYAARGRIQWWIQGTARQLRKVVPRGSRIASPTDVRRDGDDPPVVAVPHPLPPQPYAALIRGTDIGLFLYDSWRYYARCSGILVEMLSAGVPVVVPAGCWPAEQIAPRVHDHAAQAAAAGPLLSELRGADLVWRPAGTAVASEFGSVRLGDCQHGCWTEVSVPEHATDAVCSFVWRAPRDRGTYVRLELQQSAADGSALGRTVRVLGHDRGDGRVAALVSLDPHGRRVRCALSNAYHSAPVAIDDFAIQFLGPTADGRPRPQSAVGLSAADATEIPRLLRELIEHHAHYRATARDFARTWYAEHHPRQTLARLLDRAGRAADRRAM